MKKIPTLNYEIYGEGKTVVLLHGYLASSRYWQKTATALSKKYRVIAIDLLGFGKSPKPACSRYDYDAHIASIDATLDKIGVTDQFILVGHSMGALLALRYASQNGARVKKLLLANMPVFMSKTQAKQEIHSTNVFYRIGLRPGMHSIVWPLFRLIIVLKVLPQRIGENAAARRSYMFQNTGISRLRSLRNIIFSPQVQNDIEALRVKTVILSGLQDRKGYLHGLPHLPLNKLVTISNIAGGHHLPLTQPEMITKYI